MDFRRIVVGVFQDRQAPEHPAGVEHHLAYRPNDLFHAESKRERVIALRAFPLAQPDRHHLVDA